MNSRIELVKLFGVIADVGLDCGRWIDVPVGNLDGDRHGTIYPRITNELG
jgi:hypothetical protein